MGKEIERKFLVTNDSYKEMATRCIEIRQGYLSRAKEATVRVRTYGGKAFLTVKGPNAGAVRNEWEYPVPTTDALEMLREVAQGNVIEKTRYIIDYRGRTWEVDEFHGCHQGLVTAEIELPSEDAPFLRPDFIGEEVTGDLRYYNSNLS